MERLDQGKRCDGRGRIASAGRRIELRTEARIVDCRRCREEPLSGVTEATAGDHRAMVRYDGADNCNGRSPLFVDGQRHGSVEVSQICLCSASPGHALRGSLAALVVLLGALAALRLRRG